MAFEIFRVRFEMNHCMLRRYHLRSAPIANSPSSRYAVEPGSTSGSVPWLLSIVPECYCHGEVRHGDAARSGDLIAASSWERLLRFKDQLISNRFPTDWHRMFFRQILRRYHLFSISIAPSPSSRYAPPNRHPGMPLM